MSERQLSVFYGLCECGCGKPTRVATQTRSEYGHVKGEPVRFVVGHAARVFNTIRKPVRYAEEDRGHDTPCWIWQLATDPNGYGRDRSRLAHRRTYEEINGPIPDGLELDHLCRIPSCVNPAHLEPVTHTENLRRGSATKLSRSDVRTIREWYPVAELSALEMAEAFGVSRASIYRAVNSKENR